MTTEKVGAPINDATRWHSIDWEVARRTVRRLQMRIAKAVKEGCNQPGRPIRRAFEMLEPYDGKLSRTVLRRERG